MAVRLASQGFLSPATWCLLDGDLARAEPKRLRYCLLHTAGLLVERSRQRHLRIAEGWPWAHDLAAAFSQLHQLPIRT